MVTPEMREIGIRADEIRTRIRVLFELAENCGEITFQQLRDLRILQNDLTYLTSTWGL